MATPVNVVRFQNKVRAITGIRGANPIPSLDELLPVVAIESDRMEWGFPGQELFAGGTNTQPAVAANLSMVGVRNPAGSGVRITVVAFMADSITGAFRLDLRVRPRRVSATGLFTLTGTVPGSPRDTRWEDTQQVLATGQVITGTNTVLFGFAVGASETSVVGQPPVRAELGFPVVLGPDSDFYVIASTAVNSELRGAFAWYEEALERGLPS